ncbi:MAG TPA: ATP-binding cassette domain-containing protein [Acidobacteriaceae bacterium]|nr:ATP-binding cassette domain-containing protein [Acidobacteriaceae bacterium]
MIVDIDGLTKIYDGKPRVVAVDDLHLSVRRGGIFGLLGPNGAGKTTTISVCTTRALPTRGRVLVAGVDVVASPATARINIGVVPQYNTLDRSLTVFENLYFHCRYFGLRHSEARVRSSELLAQFHLEERSDAYPQQLSGGLAQRLLIARAIAHRPAVLFLDEPSAGLDPQSRIAMWEGVRALHNEGITVVLTTHYMEEADELCEQVAIIDHGKILVNDSPARLKSSLGAQTIYQVQLKRRDDLAPLIARLKSLHGVSDVEPTPEGVRMFAQSADGLLPAIVVAAQEYSLSDISITEPTLETVFIRLTGRDLRE